MWEGLRFVFDVFSSATRLGSSLDWERGNCTSSYINGGMQQGVHLSPYFSNVPTIGVRH